MTRPALPELASADQQSGGHMPRIETSGADAAAIAGAEFSGDTVN